MDSFELIGPSAGELIPYDPEARDARPEEDARDAHVEPEGSPDLEEIVSKLVELHEKVKDLKDGIKAIEQAAEAQRYSKPALKRVVARRLMTEDQRLAADREQRAYEDMRRALGDWRETPLGATADPA